MQDDFHTKHNVAQGFAIFDRFGRSTVYVRIPDMWPEKPHCPVWVLVWSLDESSSSLHFCSSQSAANLQMNLRGCTSLAPTLADKQAFNKYAPKLSKLLTLRHFPTCTFTPPCHFLLQSCSTCSNPKQELDVNLF